MDPKRANKTQKEQPEHVDGDPASLQEDPAQFYPTGGAGLLDPANDRERDFEDMPNADEAEPKKDV